MNVTLRTLDVFVARFQITHKNFQRELKVARLLSQFFIQNRYFPNLKRINIFIWNLKKIFYETIIFQLIHS